ncbi:chaperonin 10-like protein [Geopyxis carbonaria]|nr:chaperonin 10-like protein [Geopyxis carbonaria]
MAASNPPAPTGPNPSFILTAIDSLSIEDRPIPPLTNPTDVLIRVTHTGICGSDVHYWTHGRIGSFVLTAPMVLGHESAGIIHSVGAAVTTLAPGDRVALEPGIPCRFCPACKGGSYNLCPDMRFAATPPYDGSLCKYYVLPADFCTPLPAGVSTEAGALLEPLAVGVHVARQAGVAPGDHVVVFGAGPVGLLTAGVAAAFGAATVSVVDIAQARLDFAAKFAGVTGVFNSVTQGSQDAAENAKKILAALGLPAAGVDKAIDATGAPPCIAAAVHVLRSGGTLVQAGMGPAEITFPIVAMAAKELTVKGSFRYKQGDYALAVQLVASGKVKVGELVSHRFAFESAEEAFGVVKRGEGIKVVIEGVKD